MWAAVHAAPLGAGEVDAAAGDVFGVLLEGRGLHSSTFRLNVSTFCGVRFVHNFPPVYQSTR